MNGFRESDAMPSNVDDHEEHGEEDDRSHRSNPSPGHSHHRGHHYASTNRCERLNSCEQPGVHFGQKRRHHCTPTKLPVPDCSARRSCTGSMLTYNLVVIPANPATLSPTLTIKLDPSILAKPHAP